MEVQQVHNERRVVGYYGLSPTAVEPAILPRKVRTGQPPNPLPCLLLGQLGAVRTTTMKAFPEAAYREIVNSLPRA